jgi:Transglycosylase-like domain
MARVPLLLLSTFVVGAAWAFSDGGPESELPPPPPLTVPGGKTGSVAEPPSPTLEAIAHCESRGDPTAVSSDGVFRGKYQFDVTTWQSLGGSGDPALASEREQDRRARALAAERGSAPWPVCGSARTG